MPAHDHPAELTRSYTPATLRIERRGAGTPAAEPPQIVGHASVFDQWTTLYEGRWWTWREVIRPGAYAHAIAEKQDVRSLFNHDPNFVLGRTKSGTLSLVEDAVGLLSRTTPPDTPTIRDLVLAPIERGDVSGMSFAWKPRLADTQVVTTSDDGTRVVDQGGLVVTLRYEGERLVEEWQVKDADLFDVSPVTYPAYSGTDVALRSRDLAARIAECDRPHPPPTPPHRTRRRDRAARLLDLIGADDR